MASGRADEQVAQACMAKVLGCAVEVHDDNSRPSMFDFAFELADGRLGAAEMTTITDPVARGWQALRNRQHTIPNTSLAFRVVRNGAQVRANDVLRHLPRLAELAETCDESDINRLAQQLRFSGDLAIEWLNGCGARITGLRNHAHPGAVYFDGDGGGSFVPDNMDGLIDWLNEEHWFALTETSAALPSTAPAPPGRIMTGLWLIPDYGKFIVSWMNVQGWRKHDLLS